MSVVLNESVLDAAIYSGGSGMATVVQHRRLLAIPERWAAGFEENFGKLIAIPNAAVARLEKRKDGSLSPKGQAAVVTEVATDSLGALSSLYGSVLPGIRRQHGTAEVALFAAVTPPKPSDAAGEQRANEIRASILQAAPTQLERGALLATAVDPEVISAILHAPPLAVRPAGGVARFHPFVDPKLRSSLLLERARTLQPAAVEELQALENLASVYEQLFKTVAGIFYGWAPNLKREFEVKLASK